MAKTKKMDFKKMAKKELSKQIKEFLQSMGIEVEDGIMYGFTEGTLVAHMEQTDIQIKLITPKAGIVRYEIIEEVEE